jgi:hypothetical protein
MKQIPTFFLIHAIKSEINEGKNREAEDKLYTHSLYDT